ncbi:aminoglycoside phosphotransferase family protein [Methylomonas methanica]|uniref:Aminoglycoside phosphotransferase n=1 Tax=Methylomonas methanica (strain DSM 25384 / MC09) TaxID=857087 RepID=G0A775_METMM|nr:phosphotransferase [Methylomonas methanica]AEF99368.1 aminoglycoside phosphotransferase [Methylomonas methanica MC09]
MCYPSLDPRADTLISWLTDDLGLQILQVEPASSDASFRRYFRVKHADGCHVVMDAPPERENTAPFIRNAALLQTAGLHVPAIYQQNLEQGFLLLEDLGSQNFLDTLKPDNADALYRSALDSLFKLQQAVDPSRCGLPAYDRALLSRELAIFYEWFLDKRLGIVLPSALRQALDDCLIDSALQQPQVCVHRDYHSRNLMVLDEESPGVIDFQDAVIGPITYDVVSLLRDCYIRWPVQQVVDWLELYYQRLLAAGMVNCDFRQFKGWFDLMGLQRHLKAIGIFSRLQLRDDKPAYLADIPRTMAYVGEVCRHYPELAEFNGFLEHQVLPVYQARL